MIKLLNSKFKDGYPEFLGQIKTPDGYFGVALKLVDAQNLKEIINSGLLSEVEFLIIFSKLIELVRQLHSLGYIHGDIKPENTLVKFDKEPNGFTKVSVFLIDFQFSHNIFRKG